MLKAELRKLCLTRQLSVPTEQRAAWSREIARLFFETTDLSHVSVVHCFISIEKFNEPDTSPLFHGIWKNFPRVTTLVPRITSASAGEMESVSYTAETEVKVNAWNISEPLHDELIDSETIDLVVVPGLCFDREGGRVGYGKGFYDRFLKSCRADCQTVGIGYFPPVEKIDDSGDHDVKVDRYIYPPHAEAVA
jgi:5-formyltetrahydrofolate cyclo-ligase